MNFRIAWVPVLTGLLAAGLLAGCRASHYRKAADREVYGIIGDKEEAVLGKETGFTIDTRHSERDPQEIPSEEIIQERLSADRRVLPLEEALRVAVGSNRQYQFRKENLYLSALTLTRERYEFRPQFFAGTTASAERTADGRTRSRVGTRMGVDQVLKTGGRIGLDIANDLLRFHTGDPNRTAISSITVNLFQPLLRGAGAAIAAEGLTQAERNVIYEVRDFSHFQNAFALDIVAAYFRLLQQQDTVRNEYNNYQSLIAFRERAEALAVDRLPEFQVDQAKQDELRAKSRYILAVERYLGSLDDFKISLGLPLGHEIQLDPKVLDEVREIGLLQAPLTEIAGYEIAVQSRLDLLNEIDRFEDSKRRIKVTANQLKPDLNIFAEASLQSQGRTDYANFDLNDYRGSAGVQLNLPLDRLRERNAHRASLISFERQLRSLSLSLDNVRDAVNQGLRTLEQARQSYEIQLNARTLADRRVESATLLLQAGRAQTRDLLEAQNAQLLARNAVTQALVDYHLARLRLILDIGRLDTGEDRFWLRDHAVAESLGVPAVDAGGMEIVPPDQLFGEPL